MTSRIDPIFDPHWFADTLNVDAGFMQFVHTDRTALAAAPFLDERFSGGLSRRTHLALDRLPGNTALPSANPPFIFHTAFCCSTLLARALDHPGINLSLKEPKILMDLADARRISVRLKQNPDVWPGLVRSVVSILSRRFTAHEAILIKPTNLANNLIQDILVSGSPILLLYSNLRSFLVSVIKEGEGRRAFMRGAFNTLRLDPAPIARIPDRQATEFTDLQVATLVWRHQMEDFVRILRGPFGDQVRTLDSAILLARPAATITALNGFLSLGLPPETIRAVADGPVFSIDSKNRDRDYSPKQRAADVQRVEAKFGDSLEKTLTWAKELRLALEIPATIPNALEISAPSSQPRDAG